MSSTYKLGRTIWLRLTGETGSWPVEFDLRAEGIIAGEDGTIYEDKIKAMTKAIREVREIDIFTHNPHTWERIWLVSARAEKDIEGKRGYYTYLTHPDGRGKQGTERTLHGAPLAVIRQVMDLEPDLARAVRVQDARQRAGRLERKACALVNEAMFA